MMEGNHQHKEHLVSAALAPDTHPKPLLCSLLRCSRGSIAPIPPSPSLTMHHELRFPWWNLMAELWFQAAW